MRYILVIDQGTTATGVSLVDEKGTILVTEDTAFPQIYPKPGWVEHSPAAIWDSVLQGIQKLFARSQVNPKDVVAIGITNQRETTVAWDRKGEPLYNAIVWQCRRTAQRAQKLKSKKQWLFKKTGLVNDPYFSATKMEWLLKNVPVVAQASKSGDLCLGTIDSYLVYRFTQGASFVTDVTNASRTLLLSLQKLVWDKDLLKLFSIKESALPQVLPSNSLFGVTKGVPGLPDGIPIHGVLGDQQSALFGQMAWNPGEGKITYGTGSFILVNIGAKPRLASGGILTTVAWQLTGQKPIYAFEGGAFICGAAIQWLEEGLGLIKEPAEVEELAQSVPDSLGVIFIPALTGLGAPHWRPEARGAFLGITRGTKKAHLARAVLDALSMQNVDILQVMEKGLGKKIKTLGVDGGASKNNLLMQLQSDHSGVTIVRPKQIETTTLGAAFMAGLGVGLWGDVNALKNLKLSDATFIPHLPKSKRRILRQEWKRILQKI